MKLLYLGLLLLFLPGSGLLAQTASGGALSDSQSGAGDDSAASNSSGEGRKKTGLEAAPQGPTVIDSQNMDYDEKTRIAIFTGDYYGVYVKDPSFTVNCDKLTAYMRRGAASSNMATGARTKPVAPSPATSGTTRANGLQRAIAEGGPDRPVVIVQDKPAENGEQPQHNVGIAEKADYNADTGDVILTGWPRVSQGINTQIATAESTVMIMNRDGHTMKTHGPSRTVIQEQDQTKKSGTDSSTDTAPAESPASNAQ